MQKRLGIGIGSKIFILLALFLVSFLSSELYLILCIVLIQTLMLSNVFDASEVALIVGLDLWLNLTTSAAAPALIVITVLLGITITVGKKLIHNNLILLIILALIDSLLYLYTKIFLTYDKLTWIEPKNIIAPLVAFFILSYLFTKFTTLYGRDKSLFIRR